MLVDDKSDTLTKLLYATLWKNGDLLKIKHIIEGITSSKDKRNDEKDDGLVFYQFGKHLNDNTKEPIIDQHVLRAFGLFQKTILKEIKASGRKFSVKEAQKQLVNDYKEWMASLQNIEANPGFLY